MMEKIKWYLVQVGLKKYAPVGAMAGLGALGTFMTAHAGLLEKYGVTYGIWPFTWTPGQEPTGPCILVELDTLSAAATTAIVALVTMAIRAGEHHTIGAITPPIPVAGGIRAGDPPKEPQPQ
jgi:hypothetical protein